MRIAYPGLFLKNKYQLFSCRLKGGSDVDGGTPLEVIKVGVLK